MPKKESTNSFNNFFEEPFFYGDSYGYAVIARNEQDTADKIQEYLEFNDCGHDFIQRLRRELRVNAQECWVRYQGYLDDDGQFQNGWVITSEWMGGRKGWKLLWASDYDRHYVTYGHRYEPKADEPGNRVNYSYNNWNCDVCNQINQLRDFRASKAKIIAEDFYTASPKYRTKSRLIELISGDK